MKSILTPRTLAMAVLCTAMGLGAWQSASAAVPQDTLMIGKPSDPQTDKKSADKKSALREQALADAGVQTMLEVFPAEIRDVEEM